MKYKEPNKKRISILVLLTYILMVVVNIVANVLPLNGVKTSEVSDKYPNLFAPIGYTFGIWLVIYVLLAIYVSYQFKFNSRRPDNNDRVVRKVNSYFIITNILNSLWIVAWHFGIIGFSLILMVLLLFFLIMIRITISNRSSMNKHEQRSIQIPFSIYFAWITLATVTNVVTYLVSTNWDRLGYDEVFITVIVILISLFISIVTALRFGDIIYSGVIIWSFLGILIKHISSDYFSGAYPIIIKVLIFSIIATIVTMIYIIVSKRPRRRRRKHSN